MNIYLLSFAPHMVNGVGEFMRHLQIGMTLAGHTCVIIKLSDHTEHNFREQQLMGFRYRNANLDELLYAQPDARYIICNASHKTNPYEYDKLLGHRTIRVCHHATEHDETRALRDFSADRTVLVRKAVQARVPGTFIAHPYHIKHQFEPPNNRKLALSLSRVAKAKNIHIIAEANLLLPKSRAIKVYGALDRMYAYYTLARKYPGLHLEGQITDAEKHTLLDSARWLVNLTTFPYDGGGTEYATLHAWEHCVMPILHTQWVQAPGGISAHCCSASAAQELAALVQTKPPMGSLRDNYKWLIHAHSPLRVARAYVRKLDEIKL